jgi:hypothetical protein
LKYKTDAERLQDKRETELGERQEDNRIIVETATEMSEKGEIQVLSKEQQRIASGAYVYMQ